MVKQLMVVADHDKCIASGACALAAPEIFGQDDDGVVVILTRTPSPEQMEDALDAIRACPAGVIWTEETSDAE